MHNHHKTGDPARQARRDAIPERFQRIIDRVMDHDREWFLANPEHNRFVRDAVPGEYGPFNSGAELTLVINFLGQVRLRSPVLELTPSKNGFMALIEPTGEMFHVPVVRLGAA